MSIRTVKPEANPFAPTIYVESVASQEPDERHIEAPRHVHRQAARSGDRAHDGHPGREALFRSLEAAAAADHDDVVAQRQSPLQERPPDELVGRIVAADVFPEREEVALGVEEGGRVQPARRLEEPLRLPELLRQGIDGLRRDLRSRRDHGTAAQLQLLQALLAAHAAGTSGVEVAFEWTEIVVVAAQLDVHDVVALLGVHLGIDAVADLLYVVR